MKQKVRDLSLHDNEIRLQLYIARCGIASRRAAEKLILDGRIKVNGELITTLGTKVKEKDIVLFDNTQIQFEETKRYVLLNKPAGYVSSLKDEKDRETAADLLKPFFKERLYNVGRLDMFSKGLLLFTNDGEFSQKLSHPSSQIEKEYIVESTYPIPSDLVEKFQKGIRVEGVFYKCRSAKLVNNKKLQVILIEGKNREIRKVFEFFSISIKSLSRTRIGHLTIDGIEEGKFLELSVKDIEKLFKTI